MLVELLRLKTQCFCRKLPFQKPILRKIKWGVQNLTITWNGVLPVTNLYLWNLWQGVELMNQPPKYSYSYFLFYLRELFLCEYPEEVKVGKCPILITLLIRSNCPESYNAFLDSYFFNLRNCLLRIFQTVTSKNIPKKKVQFS